MWFSTVALQRQSLMNWQNKAQSGPPERQSRASSGKVSSHTGLPGPMQRDAVILCSCWHFHGNTLPARSKGFQINKAIFSLPENGHGICATQKGQNVIWFNLHHAWGSFSVCLYSSRDGDLITTWDISHWQKASCWLQCSLLWTCLNSCLR